MVVDYSKHSNRITSASIVTLIVIGLISFTVTGCGKEEKGEQQTPPPGNVDKSDIIINITKEGEILIEGEKVDLDSIKSRMKDFKNEHPDGNIVITCDKDSLYKKALEEVLDQVRAAKVKNVVVAAEKINSKK